MRTTRRPHVIRGFAAASIATFIALASHVWVGGTMPGMLGIAVPWMLSVMVCTLLAGRRLSLGRLAASVVLSQLLFHVLFVLGSIEPQVALGPHEHTMSLMLPADGTLVPTDAGMWAAHAIAATVTIGLLHRGELVVHAIAACSLTLLAWARRAVAVPVLVLIPTAPLRHPAVSAAPARREPWRASLTRRGPPPRLI